MRALVVYESRYGNTHAVASSIADGLRGTYQVTLVPVTKATGEAAARDDSVLRLDPGEQDPFPRARLKARRGPMRITRPLPPGKH